MSQLIVLIDPNDENVEGFIQSVNTLRPTNLWVGCSTSSGAAVKNVFLHLEVNASLYPGNLDQVKMGYDVSEKVFLSDPLFYSNPEVEPLLVDVVQFGMEHFADKMELMNYVLLHHNCSAAKVLGVEQVYSNEEVLKALENTRIHPTIYLEGGSRNQLQSMDSRVELIKAIREGHQESRIIYGGGISSVEDAKLLRDLEIDVLVSNHIHKNPEMLERHMELFA